MRLICVQHGVPRVSGATALDKSEQAREKERRQIEQYKQLEKDVSDRVRCPLHVHARCCADDKCQQIHAADYSNATLQLTSKLLSQNPEYYTIWNYRRILLQDVFTREAESTNGIDDVSAEDESAAKDAGLTLPQQEIALLIKEDLQFLIPLLKQFPKCYWIWNHRSWLLRTATSLLPTKNSMELWQGELSLIGKMLALDSRNFHGWSYRREVIGEIERLSSNSMAEAEFEYTTRMIQTNLSNFSAWHYRSQLIPQLLAERSAGSEERRKMLNSEFELITRALYTDSYDQSLWFYHQYLVSTLDPTNKCSTSILDPCTNADRLYYLDQELDSVKDMLDGAEDCKYIYQALLEYANRYLEVEAGNKKVTTMEMKAWLEELRMLDPLRAGRWTDLERTLKL